MSTYILLSHAVAFGSLFVGSIFDIETSEVPDSVSVVGVVGGIFLHIMASLQSGMNFSTLLNPSILFSQPFTWLQAMGDPILWCLGMGIAFSVFGWGLYFLGMWGGADAFAMSVLGFEAPTALTSLGVFHSVNLFLNMLLLGFVYTLGFAIYRSRGQGAIPKTYQRIKQNERRISLEIVGAGVISSLGAITGGFNPVVYFSVFVSLIFLYRYMKVIQDDMMTEEVDVSELEGGEVLTKGSLDDDRVRGITEDEIDQLDAEKVEVRSGVRFIPVFPAALVITDLFGGGIWLMFMLFSL